MAKKVFRWFIGITGLVVVLLLAAAIGLYYYVGAHHEQFIREAAQEKGLKIAYQKICLDWWDHFPQVTVFADSLSLLDTSASASFPPFVTLGNFRAEISLADLWSDTIRLQRLELAHGGLHFERDSGGLFNFGSLFAGEETPDEGGYRPVVDWSGVQVEVRDMNFFHRDPDRKKLVDLHLDTVLVTGTTTGSGRLLVNADLRLDVKGITLNTDKGAYLTDTDVRGKVSARIGKDSISILPTTLQMGPQDFAVAADIHRGAANQSIIYIACNEVDYDLTRPLLHDRLREKLANYHVKGRFPVAARVILLPEEARDPEIHIDFHLDGQDVRIKQYAFTRVYADGRMINRLTTAEGGIEGSRKNLRIALDSVSGQLGAIHVRTPEALIAATENDSRLTSLLTLSGPAASLGRRLGNRDFLFERGRFKLITSVAASLDDEDELVASSDGQLLLTDIDVRYRPAGVTLPFARIDLDKKGQDVRFDILSRPLSTGFSFQLKGALDNLTPLLLDRPGEPLNTQVALMAPRIDWTDFLTFFGTEGYFAEEEITEEKSVQNPQASMRKTLLGLRKTFHPSVEVHFDTVAYLDVFTLTDFTTGLHFENDNLVLEQTTFDWAGSQLGLGASLDLNQAGQTPFELSVAAEHLDLNKMRSTLNYFGLQLPEELDRLPDDLSIDFEHQGRLDDTIGVLPGYNAGKFIFDDGRDQLFGGRMTYTPGANGLRTQLHLSGDPQVVNVLFGAENFFFGSGDFTLDLDLEGSPKNLEDLVRTGRLKLRINDSRIAYAPADVYFPLRSFAVDFYDEHADYGLEILTGTDGHSVTVDGTMDDITAFLFPEAGRSFKLKADLRAPFLEWSDLATLAVADSTTNADKDFNPQSFLSATEGIFRSFRPDLQLAIDTFLVEEDIPLTAIFAHLRLQDSVGLVLDESGFNVDDGSVRFSARYALDELKNSPFFIDWRIDTLDFEKLLVNLSTLGLSLPADLTHLKGELSMEGSIYGRLNETNQRLQLDHTTGKLSYLLSGVELANSPVLMAIGRKAKMKKRFKELRFAPLSGEIELDSGRISLPRFEIQNTGIQLFVEGAYDLSTGPDLLVSVPLRNIGRGVLETPPPLTGYAFSGWKVYLVMEPGKDGTPKTKFRLGRRRYFKERGQLDTFLAERKRLRELRKSQ